MAKEFTFEVWLKGTPEQQQAEAERQALALASHTRAHLTEAERLIGRGQLLERTARLNLESATDDTRELALSQLADALAMQGRYQEAAAYHPNEERQEYFENLITALEMPDDEKCECADSEAKLNGVDLEITPRFEATRIFSPIHNDVVSLVTCAKCGHQNAREARSRLLPQQAALNQAEAGRRKVLSDAQVLNATAK